ncbi:MAG: hypothetical protein RJB38_606 [Pseudomonadota bacterium]|jgi:hypothetical protein
MKQMSRWTGVAIIWILSLGCNSPEGAARTALTLGTKDGGGGIGVLCGTTLRTLDVYEAEEIHHLPPVPKFPTFEENVRVYGSPLAAYWSEEPVDTTDPSLQQQLVDLLKSEIIGRFSDIPGGTTLPPTQDATLPPIPGNCSFAQIAIYSDEEGIIYRDASLWWPFSLELTPGFSAS